MRRITISNIEKIQRNSIVWGNENGKNKQKKNPNNIQHTTQIDFTVHTKMKEEETKTNNNVI